MLVKFYNKWFAPTVPSKHDGDRVFSGKLYPKGEHDVPDELEEFLPASAKVINKKKNYVEPEVDKTDTLSGVDLARDSSDLEEAVRQEAEKTRTSNKNVRK